MHFLWWLFIPLVLGALSPLYLLLVNGPAFRQKRTQVAIRERGKRFLGKPQDGHAEARVDVEFALLSEAAYQRTPNAKPGKKGLQAFDPDALLASMGWSLCKTFPTGKVKERVDKVHLQVEVWTNASTKKVAVAFGGTVARNIKDWLSDLRWFLPKQHDEYTEIVHGFGRAFCLEYEELLTKTEWEFLREAKIFSTGHSLGGGLAHQFAYALPLHESVPRVTKVFAFDSSPVTGFYSVSKHLRDSNKQGLQVDRIYQRGEVLAIVRSLVNFFHSPSSVDPTIRQLRYNLFHSFNPIADHSMTKFAYELSRLSEQLSHLTNVQPAA
jgi:hypothetical protein